MARELERSRERARRLFRSVTSFPTFSFLPILVRGLLTCFCPTGDGKVSLWKENLKGKFEEVSQMAS